jgi:hypothetical protein
VLQQKKITKHKKDSIAPGQSLRIIDVTIVKTEIVLRLLVIAIALCKPCIAANQSLFLEWHGLTNAIPVSFRCYCYVFSFRMRV